MSTAAPPPAPKRRDFGALAFIFALIAVAVRMVFLVIHGALPADIAGTAKEAMAWLFIATLLFAVPLLEIAGVVLGIGSLFRSGDRKVLGILGALLNVVSLLSGITFGIILIAYIGQSH